MRFSGFNLFNYFVLFYLYFGAEIESGFRIGSTVQKIFKSWDV